MPTIKIMGIDIDKNLINANKNKAPNLIYTFSFENFKFKLKIIL